MSQPNLGNHLNQIVTNARAAMFEQGELAQLTYGAFDIAVHSMQASSEEEIKVTFPVGYKADRTAIPSTRTYNKEELLRRYQYLAFHQLAVNSIVQLVTLVETMMGDVVRSVVLRFPQKLGGKRTLPIKEILESTSLEEVHLRATDALLNDLSYKSPAEFAEAVQPLLSINLLECPAFHRYIEVKATRDIFIHNRGIANDVYARKSGSHARVKVGMSLPADVNYFLESYEHCLQVADWLEVELHCHWHSSEYEDRQRPQLEMSLPQDAEAAPDVKAKGDA
jgi:hypothetical protein